MSQEIGTRKAKGPKGVDILYGLDSVPERFLLSCKANETVEARCRLHESGARGFICTREKGHQGFHVAHYTEGWLVAWSEETGERRENPETYVG